MGLGLALIIVGVIAFHAGAIGLIVHIARAASGPRLDRFIALAAISAIAGLALVAGGVSLLA
ncbi:hypothetical protein [Maricaulis sp.]|uniref:hypothetical protein n=1 Tax=Maricaulis sp. TaxID=1486257 RepID=UPI002620F98E|nr:hypothetical protein [Maricaulis sp.]